MYLRLFCSGSINLFQTSASAMYSNGQCVGILTYSESGMPTPVTIYTVNSIVFSQDAHYSQTHQLAVQFVPEGLGTIQVDGNGDGSFTTTVCTQTGNSVACSPQSVSLDCDSISPTP
jgi:hypothetical protein